VNIVKDPRKKCNSIRLTDLDITIQITLNNHIVSVPGMKYDRLTPDTSVIIEGLLSRLIEGKKITLGEIIIHEAVVAELEHQANQDKAIGFLGIDELDRIRGLKSKFNFDLRFSGRRPTPGEIRYASLGEIDSMVRELAFEEDATLLTSDKVQARIARAKGIRCMLQELGNGNKKIRLDSFFDNTTMSVHLRGNVIPYAKKGMPGNWEFVPVEKEPLGSEDIQEISREIIEETKARKDGFIEIERPGSTIIQLGNYRIVITKPPFSDGWEITAVRPVKKLELKDYSLSEKLQKRIIEQAEGILIAGSPGMGKSTFAAALAEFYSYQKKIVKTVEAPRDLVLPEKITQYAISHGDAQEIHDILLLSRPDYTIFDEMRNTDDFRLFSDLRLSGIGFVGVVHATSPVDAIQRFVGRIELGVIPQVIDTVIFIKDGQVARVLSLKIVVKVPSGMTESDLARPVVIVNDFETGKLEYEMYSYGEETVVVPVAGTARSPLSGLAQKQIMSEMKKYTNDVEVEMLSDNRCRIYVPESRIAKIIGKQGRQIAEIEKRIGIGIDIASLESRHGGGKETSGNPGKTQAVSYNFKIMPKSIIFIVGQEHINQDVDVLVDGDYLLTAKVSKKAMVKVKKQNKIGKILLHALTGDENVELMA